MLAKQSGRVFNLDWGLLTNSWRKKRAESLAVSRVGGDVPVEGAVSTESKRRVSGAWVQGNCGWFIVAGTDRSRAVAVRQPPLIFTFQVCVYK